MISFLKQKNTQSGVTFLELIIVMAIFSILGGTLLFNFRDFTSGIDIQNLAQEVALQVRDAQASSVNGRSFVPGPSQVAVGIDWTSSYGISFDVSGGDANSFIYFFDRESDENITLRGKLNDDENTTCAFDVSECIDEIVFTGDAVIERLCVNEVSTGTTCEPSESVDRLHISFRRPSPQALIRTDGPDLETVSDATIYLRSGDDIYRRVIVGVTGQISVQIYDPQ